MAIIVCSGCGWAFKESDYHDCTDETIGSLLDHWLTRKMNGRCRFDNVELVERFEGHPELQFCGPKCRESFDKVVAARIAIGARDLDRRGFD